MKVTVAGPVAAVLVAVNVTVFRKLVLPARNTAVTPAGRPLTVTFTVPLKPVPGVNVRLVSALLPWGSVIEVGAAARVKPGGGVVTVSPMIAFAVMEPEVPVTVMLLVPVAAVAVAVKVSVAPVVVEAWLKTAVTPAGKPETTRLTVPANVPVGFTVIFVVFDAPCANDTVDAELVSVMPLPPFTLSVRGAVALSVPDAPCTTSG